MLKNYLKSAYRNIVSDKFYSLINITGLAIGIICAILILLYVQDELTYDKHHVKHERIYRIESDYVIAGKNTKVAITPAPMAPTLKDEYPEIEEIVRFPGAGIEDILFKYGEKEFYEDSLYFVDSTLFNVFTHEFILGAPENALNEPHTTVITQSFANRYFGNENPIGKVISTSNFGDFRVTGVIKNVPGNSHLKFNCLLSIATLAEMIGVERFNDNSAGSFWNVSVYSYILLKEKADVNNILEKFPGFYDKYMAELGDQIQASFNLMVQPLTDIHFHSTLEWDLPTGNYTYVIVFSCVAVFILLIACINYMNMATARSANRAKEVGIRKVAGAHKGLLIRRFLSESMVLTLISLIIALIAVWLLMPFFNILADKNLSFAALTKPVIIFGILIITIFVGIVSGSYPSFYLSSFLPVIVLKGDVSQQQSKGLLRKILVVFQFAISVIMIIGTLIIFQQQNFIKNEDLGFDKENIVIIPVRDTSFVRQITPFREELLKNPDIFAVATSSAQPNGLVGKVVFRVERNGEMIEEVLNLAVIDYDYIDLMNIEIKEGRNYDRSMTTDQNEAFIINETAAKNLGWGYEALGKRMQLGIELDGTARRDGPVIGILKDFHFKSIHNKIEPYVLLLSEDPLGNIYVKMNEENISQTLDFIRNKREEFNNILPFNYYFVEESLNEMYAGEKKLGNLFTIFSLLTIFTSCLGLLGLTSFITEQRTKEIGIRKVLGSSNTEIAILIIRGFLILVLIANIIAWYPAYWAMGHWLQEFAYKINIGFVPFILAAVIAFIIAILTLLYHSVKAANKNPADSLRYE